MITATVDQRDLSRLNRLISDLGKYTKVEVDKMIKDTMRSALQSAAKATKPIIKGKKMRNKHLYKPLVNLPSIMGYWYNKKGGRNRPFKTEKELTIKQMRKRGLVKVTKAIKSYSKGKISYTPYAGKRNLNDPKFRIHAAGLAKDGWYRAMRGFDEKPNKINTRRSNARFRGIHKYRNKEMLAEAINMVSYISKSSPDAARVGLKKATNSMVHRYQPKVEKAIERRFNR